MIEQKRTLNIYANFMVTEVGTKALLRTTKNEQRVLFGLISCMRSGDIVAISTRKELAKNLGMHINSLARAYGKLFIEGVITPAGYGRTMVNPASFYVGNHDDALRNRKVFDRTRKFNIENREHRDRYKTGLDDECAIYEEFGLQEEQ